MVDSMVSIGLEWLLSFRPYVTSGWAESRSLSEDDDVKQTKAAVKVLLTFGLSVQGSAPCTDRFTN